MAVSIRNIEKFLKDHPEFAGRREQIMDDAQRLAEGSVLTGGAVEEILGDDAELFFKETTRDPEHIRLGLEDLQAA